MSFLEVAIALALVPSAIIGVAFILLVFFGVGAAVMDLKGKAIAWWLRSLDN